MSKRLALPKEVSNVYSKPSLARRLSYETCRPGDYLIENERWSSILIYRKSDRTSAGRLDFGALYQSQVPARPGRRWLVVDRCLDARGRCFTFVVSGLSGGTERVFWGWLEDRVEEEAEDDLDDMVDHPLTYYNLRRLGDADASSDNRTHAKWRAERLRFPADSSGALIREESRP